VTVPPPGPGEGQAAGKCGHSGGRNKVGYCQNPAGWGTDHAGYGYCKRHGGTAPNMTRHAARLWAEDLMGTYGGPIPVHPLQALLEEVARANGHVLWLGRQIADLSPEALSWAQTRHTIGIGPQGAVDLSEWSGDLAPLIRLYWGERDRLVSASKAALALGAAREMIALWEGQAEALADALDRAASALENALSPMLPEGSLPAVEGIIRGTLGEALDQLAASETSGSVTVREVTGQ